MTPDAVAQAVDDLLNSWELDTLGHAKAAIARSLAVKVDYARRTEGATIAMAMGGLCKELRDTLDAIGDAQFDSGDFVADLFAPVLHTQNP